jgi:ferredoxin
MKVYIEEEECIACGTSVELCPEVFHMNDEKEKAEVILPEGGLKECIDEAIDSCPVSCIHWEE